VLFFVSFELFCGNSKLVERPESSVEQEFAAKMRKKTQKNEMRGGPPTRYANPAGQGGGCIPKRFHLTREVK
jgi:hypothetical protein